MKKGSLLVNATNVDPNTCNTMKDTVTKLANQCSTPNRDVNLILAVLLITGASLAGGVAYGLHKRRTRERARDEQPLYIRNY